TCPCRCYFGSFFPAPPSLGLDTLSLHDALPISGDGPHPRSADGQGGRGPSAERRGSDHFLRLLPHLGHDRRPLFGADHERDRHRSEEHTSELQSRENLVCRLLLEKKNNIDFMIL